MKNKTKQKKQLALKGWALELDFFSLNSGLATY